MSFLTQRSVSFVVCGLHVFPLLKGSGRLGSCVLVHLFSENSKEFILFLFGKAV